MRPRSIVGPLLLIVIGVLFLANNLRPDLRYVDVLIQSWPYILIAWGVLRLIEVFVWYARSKPLPASGMGGGEWALIVLLCIIGSGMFFVHQRRPGFMMRGVEIFGESFDYAIPEKKIAAPAKQCRIVIENFRGNARISGTDTTEIKLNGRKSIRAMTETEAAQSDKDSPTELIQQGDTIIVRNNQERVTGNRRVSTDIEIVVPRYASVEGHGRLGDFDISDVNGEIDINSDNAGVRLQNIGGNVRVDTRRGDILRASNVKGNIELRGRCKDLDLENIEGQVTVSANFYNDLRFRNLAKPLRVDSALNGSFELELAKLPGEIHLDPRNFTGTDMVGPVRLSAKSLDAQIGDFTQSLDLTLDRGDVALRPSKASLGKMDVRTRSGNIELAVPPAAKFELKATTLRGDIENEYGDVLKTVEDYDRGRNKSRSVTLSGSVGQGPKINLTTDRGTVTVRKGTGEQITLPSAPPKPVPPAAPSTVQLKVERN